MTGRRPNVLVLSVDALRADRTTLHGYNRPTTPTLQRLADEAIVCDNNYAAGAFTSISLPSMFTATRPLSYGGFDNGIWNRPDSFLKRFQRAGYRTYMLSTVHWVNRYYGYGDGVDHEEQLYTVNTLAGTGYVNIKHDITAFREGTISADEFIETSAPFLEQTFAAVDDYCINRMRAEKEDRRDMPSAILTTSRFDYAKIKRIIDVHRQAFIRDKRAYALAIAEADDPQGWLTSEWYYHRAPWRLAEEAVFRFVNGLISVFDADGALLRKNRFNRYVDAGELADRVIKRIRNHDVSAPFIMWTHFFDTHVPYCAGSGKDWFKKTGNYLRELGYPLNMNVATGLKGKPRTEEDWETWSALYDAAVRYVDEHIGRIVAALDDLGLRDDTLIVVLGDHGEELGEHGDISHHYRHYEHNLRVPMMFHRPGEVPRRISNLTSLIDLAPSLADLCGVDPVEDWEGAPVTSGEVLERKELVVESFHGSPCRFDRRPLYMAVRKGRFKYLWKEYRDLTDSYSSPEPELYDIEIDPLEKNDIYDPNHPALVDLNAAIIHRLLEIPEIPRDRIIRAFGKKAVDAMMAKTDEP